MLPLPSSCGMVGQNSRCGGVGRGGGRRRRGGDGGRRSHRPLADRWTAWQWCAVRARVGPLKRLETISILPRFTEDEFKSHTVFVVYSAECTYIK